MTSKKYAWLSLLFSFIGGCVGGLLVSALLKRHNIVTTGSFIVQAIGSLGVFTIAALLYQAQRRHLDESSAEHRVKMAELKREQALKFDLSFVSRFNQNQDFNLVRFSLHNRSDKAFRSVYVAYFENPDNSTEIPTVSNVETIKPAPSANPNHRICVPRSDIKNESRFLQAFFTDASGERWMIDNDGSLYTGFKWDFWPWSPWRISNGLKIFDASEGDDGPSSFLEPGD